MELHGKKEGIVSICTSVITMQVIVTLAHNHFDCFKTQIIQDKRAYWKKKKIYCHNSSVGHGENGLLYMISLWRLPPLCSHLSLARRPSPTGRSPRRKCVTGIYYSLDSCKPSYILISSLPFFIFLSFLLLHFCVFPSIWTITVS